MARFRFALAVGFFWVVLSTHASTASEPGFTGRVVGVSDGDTITVLSDRTPVKVRLHGIDCPESGQDFGVKAKVATSDLAFGKLVNVQPIDRDRYGRTVAVVTLPDGRTLNHELVRAGYAWWFRKYAPGDGELAKLESEARTARRGLWAQGSPVPPWEWRNGAGLPVELAGKLIGNRRSLVYHWPGCPGIVRMSAKSRVVFASAKEAERAGYRAGKDCERP